MPANQLLKFSEAISYNDFLNIQMHSVTYRTKIFNTIEYRQTEGISYTDQEWIFHPMIAVSNVIYYPYTIYRYLIDRQGQTMDPKVFLRTQNHQIESQKRRIFVYENNKDVINKENREFLLHKITQSIYVLYKRLLTQDVTRADELLATYDAIIKEYSPELYNLSATMDYDPIIGYKFIEKWRNNKSRSLPLNIRLKLFFNRFLQSVKSQH